MKNGFTLIEVIVVAIIISIMVAVAIPIVMGAKNVAGHSNHIYHTNSY